MSSRVWAGDLHLLGLITQVGENQHVARLDRNREHTFQGRSKRPASCPLTTTLAPIAGWSFSSTTLPVILFWADAAKASIQGEKGQRPLSARKARFIMYFIGFMFQLG